MSEGLLILDFGFIFSLIAVAASSKLLSTNTIGIAIQPASDRPHHVAKLTRRLIQAEGT